MSRKWELKPYPQAKGHSKGTIDLRKLDVYHARRSDIGKTVFHNRLKELGIIENVSGYIEDKDRSEYGGLHHEWTHAYVRRNGEPVHVTWHSGELSLVK